MKKSKTLALGYRDGSGEKNELWVLYKSADKLVRNEIILELKKIGLFRHWLDVASRKGFNLFYSLAPLRDIFTRTLPESKHLFESSQSNQPVQQP